MLTSLYGLLNPENKIIGQLAKFKCTKPQLYIGIFLITR